MVVKMKKIKKDAILPTRGSAEAAGYDLYANSIDGGAGKWDLMFIAPGETVKIGTGIAAEIPSGYFGGIYARSGLATKQGLAPANAVGVIDCDYKGEIIVALHNYGNEEQTIYKDDRIAQLVIQPYLSFDIEEVDELSETERGEGGFGSTGK